MSHLCLPNGNSIFSGFKFRFWTYKPLKRKEMDRRSFIQQSSTYGFAAALSPFFLNACKESLDPVQKFEVNFSGKVLVIGAGAAGLTAAYALQQNGIEFELLEASDRFGGRVKRIEDFADFPIDLGGEWIHTDLSIFKELVNDPKVDPRIETIKFNPKVSLVKKNRIKKSWLASLFYSEYKFKNSTWYGFFEKYILPPIADKIVYNSPVKSIDYSGDRIRVQVQNGNQYEADRLILTVPITVLQQNRINFNPAFPNDKKEALDKLKMPDGIKVFIEFSECFYPEMLLNGGLIANEIRDLDEGDRVYYNAAFKKESNRHILGLFSQGKPAKELANAPSDEAIIAMVLKELDQYFDGQASKYYLKHVIQNWTKEPYIGGSYTQETNSSIQSVLRKPISNQLFFAGETYAEDYSTVHGAAQSAYRAVEQLLKLPN